MSSKCGHMLLEVSKAYSKERSNPSSPWESTWQMCTHNTPAGIILLCFRRPERLNQVAGADSVGDQRCWANSAVPLPSPAWEAQDAPAPIPGASPGFNTPVCFSIKRQREPLSCYFTLFYSVPFVVFLRRFKTKKGHWTSVLHWLFCL